MSSPAAGLAFLDNRTSTDKDWETVKSRTWQAVGWSGGYNALFMQPLYL